MAAYGESVGGGALLGVKLLTEQRKDIKVHRFVKVRVASPVRLLRLAGYLEQDMAKRKQPFEAVLVMFGANDGQDTRSATSSSSSDRLLEAMYPSASARDGLLPEEGRRGSTGPACRAWASAGSTAHGTAQRDLQGRGGEARARSSTSTRGRPWTRRRRRIRRTPPGRRRPSDRGGRDQGCRGGLAAWRRTGTCRRSRSSSDERGFAAPAGPRGCVWSRRCSALAVVVAAAAAAAGTEAPEHPFGEPPAPAPGVHAWAAGEPGVLLVTADGGATLEAPAVPAAAARRGRRLHRRADRLARHRRRHGAREHRRRRRLDRGRAGARST